MTAAPVRTNPDGTIAANVSTDPNDATAFDDWKSKHPVTTPEQNAERELYQQEKSADSLRQGHDTYKSEMSALSKGVTGAYQDLSKATAQAPPQQPLPPRPDAKEYEKNSMAFASSMALLGAVGSAFGRMNTTQAMNAFSGALKGWKEGNLSNYEEASAKWEQDTKATIENNKQLTQQYQAILNSKQLNIDQMMAQIKMKAAENHDDIAYKLAESNNITAFAALQDKRYKFTNDAETSSAPLIAEIRKNELGIAQTATAVISGQINPDGIDPKTNQPYTEAQKATFRQAVEIYERGGIGGKGMKGLPGGLKGQILQEEEARREAAGEPPMTPTEKRNFNQPPPRSGPAMALRKFLEENPTATADDITAFRAKSEGAVAASRASATAEPRADAAALTQLTKQKASIESFERTAIANGEKLKELANKVDKSGVPAVERWIRGGRQATGDVDVAKFNAQMQVYKAEVAKIITNPNLTGVLSDSARREVETFMGPGASAKQITGVVDLLTQDFGRRSKSIDDEINTIRTHLKGGSAAPAAGGGDGGDSGGWGKAEVVK